MSRSYIAQLMKPSMFTAAATSRLALGAIVLAGVWTLTLLSLLGSR
ncbi:MAG: hypothetical protein MUF14_00220 [Hyphomonadaceae bacterium]|nr:hypothetical protein [Hyphomonadaceae bacterium]